ncbi:MAG: cbb3-type cytochrome oxidase assembly protein CcoS [Flavobacteriaceae bacterium]|nr:cbb3-type cytochrome oxidase assembly protein CcoS [Flavobacteriaceae bacterium]
MEVLILVLPFALLISLVFVLSFVFAVKNGQFDDLETPAFRMLLEEKKINKKIENNQIQEIKK